jgi:hypothetical protein
MLDRRKSEDPDRSPVAAAATASVPIAAIASRIIT